MYNYSSFIVIFFLVLLSYIPNKQDCFNIDSLYFLRTEIAEKLFNNRQYSEAYLLYKCAFDNDNDDVILINDCLKMVAICFALNKNSEAEYYLEKCVLGGADLDYISNYKPISDFLDFESFLNFKNNYPNLQKKYELNLDTQFIHTIEILIKSDKTSRENDSINYAVIEKNDLKNAKLLQKLIKQKGIPCYQELKIDNRSELYALILHFCYYKETRDFYLIQAQILLNNKIITPIFYKHLIQRSNLALGKKTTSEPDFSDSLLLDIGILPIQINIDSLREKISCI